MCVIEKIPATAPTAPRPQAWNALIHTFLGRIPEILQGVHKRSNVQWRYLKYIVLNSVNKFSKPHVDKLRIFVIPKMIAIPGFLTSGFEVLFSKLRTVYFKEGPHFITNPGFYWLSKTQFRKTTPSGAQTLPNAPASSAARPVGENQRSAEVLVVIWRLRGAATPLRGAAAPSISQPF